MQPPRVRRPKVSRPPTRLGRSAVVETGSALGTLLLVRIVVTLLGPERSAFTWWVDRVTEPLIWPASQLPGGDVPLVRALTVADLLTPFAIALLGAVALGIIAGWELEGSQ